LEKVILVSLSTRHKIRVVLFHIFNFLNSFSNLNLSILASRGLVKTILVILLSFPEVSIKRFDSSDNGTQEIFLINDNLLFSDLFLPLILIEDGRSIAEAIVDSLFIFCCGVMYSEEYLYQLLEWNDCGVIMNLDHFGVTCCLTADFFVSRVLYMASSVSRHDKFHTFQSHENSFNTPETPSSKSG
jgi:hypothetical protein